MTREQTIANHRDAARTSANSREYLLGRIHGMQEAEALAASRPMAFAFHVRQDIDDMLHALREALVDGDHL